MKSTHIFIILALVAIIAPQANIHSGEVATPITTANDATYGALFNLIRAGNLTLNLLRNMLRNIAINPGEVERFLNANDRRNEIFANAIQVTQDLSTMNEYELIRHIGPMENAIASLTFIIANDRPDYARRARGLRNTLAALVAQLPPENSLRRALEAEVAIEPAVPFEIAQRGIIFGGGGSGV